MKQKNPIRTDRNPTALLLGCLLAALTGGSLHAQSLCPAVNPLATGLLAPSKIIQTSRGNFIVAEAGPQVVNHGRVSIVNGQGHRRTLLDGLPSARTFVGDFNGTTGIYLDGRTLYVVIGQGDVTLAGPVPGTERANPAPSSPLFSSLLAVHFSAATEDTTTGVTLTLTDHQALLNGERLVRKDAGGQKIAIELVRIFQTTRLSRGRTLRTTFGTPILTGLSRTRTSFISWTLDLTKCARWIACRLRKPR